MKSISGLLAACALLVGATSCQAPQAAVKSTDQVVATKSYPLKIAFQAEFSESVPPQGVVAAGSPGYLQNWGGRGNTQGQGYFMTLEGSTINADLPYYASRNLFRDVYEQPGIVLDDKRIENIEYVRSGDNRIVAIEFDVHQLTERFHVRLVIGPDKRAILILNSPQRQLVRYEGTVASL